ncbi:MAG: T9SS type A sorting domain-containing protein, partial [Flavobacteriales bacterium]
GTWTCTVTDANTCTATQNFTVTQPSALSMTASSQTNVACNGGANGAASVTAATGGAGGYTYNWTPGNPTGDGTTSVTGLTAGTWTCTVTDANACTKSQNFTVTQPSALSMTASSQTNVACNGGASGAASVTAATGGAGGYTYNWTPGNPTGDGTTSVTGLTAGTWTCTVTDANACTSSQNFTITQPSTTLTGSQTFVECAGFSVTVGSNTYTTTGIYTDVLTGSNGCDSTVTTDLTIKQPTTGSQTFVECQGFSVTVGSNTYTTTGIYTDVLTGSNGCDSTVTTDLTIKQPTTGSQTFVECAGFSVTVGSNTYTTTGVYTDVLTGSNGCDSTVTTDLTIQNAIDVTVTNSSPMLTANQAGASYQWLDCDNGNAIIPLETAQSFTATVNGNYAVEITMGSCVDTSACEAVTGVGIRETANTNVLIYPNPTRGLFTINLTNQQGAINYALTTLEGRIVKQANNVTTNNIEVDLTNESKGVYLLRISQNDSNKVYKIVRQ